MPSAPAALTISLPPTTYCAGSCVSGEVVLDFRQLQQENIEEVHVELRGIVGTWLKRGEGQVSSTQPILSAQHSLWSKGSAYPPAGSDTLRFPFQFQLPESLLPSFHYRGLGKRASVLYSVTATGVRPGRFKANKKVKEPIAVLPKDEVGAALRAGSTAGWKVVHVEEAMRKGLWGAYANARVELSAPDIDAFPLFSEFPFIISVVTKSAPLTRAKADAHPVGKPIFPVPPSSTADVQFRLNRRLKIRAKNYSKPSDTDVACFLGEGAVYLPSSMQAEVEVSEIEWESTVGDKKSEKAREEEEGRWVQRVTFSSRLILNVPPSFTTETIDCQYCLWLKVPFAGLGNDIVVQHPIVITSGVTQSVSRDLPSYAPGADAPGPEAPPQPPSYDLPPTYWDVNDHDWDIMDEKEAPPSP